MGFKNVSYALHLKPPNSFFQYLFRSFLLYFFTSLFLFVFLSSVDYLICFNLCLVSFVLSFSFVLSRPSSLQLHEKRGKSTFCYGDKKKTEVFAANTISKIKVFLWKYREPP